MPPTESQEVQTTSPNKKFLKTSIVIVAVMIIAIVGVYGTKGKQAAMPGTPEVDIEKRMQENQVPPLTEEEQSLVVKKMNETEVSPLTAEERATIEERMSETVVPQ